MHLPALIAYLQGLRENNNKAWFVMNKPAYDILRAEFIALVAEATAALSRSDPRVAGVDPKKALFRIYRDIRFSHDKTPYKTHFSASIADGGAKHWGPMYYLQIDADGRLHLGAGCYLPPRDVLARLRAHVVADHRGLGRVLKNKRFASTFGALNQDDKLARLPKGFECRHARPRTHRRAVAIEELHRHRRSRPHGGSECEGRARLVADHRDYAERRGSTQRLAARLACGLRQFRSRQLDATLSSRRFETRTKRATKIPTS